MTSTPVDTPLGVPDDLDVSTVDGVVIGGGAAGRGGALMFARSRRSVEVVDGGEPRNGPADTTTPLRLVGRTSGR